MEAPHVFGGDGAKMRSEYAPVAQAELRLHGVKTQEVVEDIFDAADTVETATTEHSADRSEAYREVHINYEALDDDCTDELVADVKTGEMFLVTQPFTPIEKNIVIRHYMYRGQPKQEEYIIAIERSLPFTVGNFFAVYTFEFFAGGGVQGVVETNRVDSIEGVVDDTGIRVLTQYDIEQFNKELAELQAHIDVSRSEKHQLATVGDSE